MAKYHAVTDITDMYEVEDGKLVSIPLKRNVLPENVPRGIDTPHHPDAAYGFGSTETKDNPMRMYHQWPGDAEFRCFLAAQYHWSASTGWIGITDTFHFNRGMRKDVRVSREMIVGQVLHWFAWRDLGERASVTEDKSLVVDRGVFGTVVDVQGPKAIIKLSDLVVTSKEFCEEGAWVNWFIV